MDEEWASLEPLGFPRYQISNHGEVRNYMDKSIRVTPNTNGIMRVGLMKPEEGKQVTVSLTRLVARMFVQGRSATFDTPLQLDGDKKNCRADNLMWRPRWFALRYTKEFEDFPGPLVGFKIQDVETDSVYDNSLLAKIKCGILEIAVQKSILEGQPCFPSWQRFAPFRD